MSRNLITSCLLVLIMTAVGSRAVYSDNDSEYRAGLALALPSIGISLQHVLSEQHTIAVVVGNGFQAQVNFTGDASDGGYFLLGAGRDSTVGLIRAGYGYLRVFNKWSFHVEASLNIPVWDRKLGGLADVGKILYLLPLGVGVHYNF